MPNNSFALQSAAKTVREQLLRRLRASPEDAGAAEMRAALEEIEVLWEELQAQSGAMADERHRYAELFDFAPEAFLITEPLGEIREANRAACELFGEQAEALEGTLLSERVAREERAQFRSRLIAARGEPEGQQVEWRSRLAAAGDTFPVLFRVRSIKVRRKNADGLCWMIRRLDEGEKRADNEKAGEKAREKAGEKAREKTD